MEDAETVGVVMVMAVEAGRKGEELGCMGGRRIEDRGERVVVG